MRHAKSIGFALWSTLSLVGAGFGALVTNGLMSLRYHEMHTLSTAFDPDPSLTRETVVRNVLEQTATSALVLLLPAALLWGFQCVIDWHDSTGRYQKLSSWVAALCIATLYLGIITADFYCLLKYPEHR